MYLIYKYDQINDVHLFHENYEKKIKLIEHLLKKLFHGETLSILNKYLIEFIKIKNISH